MPTKALLLGCITAGMLLWIGCSGDDQRPAAVPGSSCAANGEPCARDGECLSGFCDRARCAEIRQKGNFGRECSWGYIGGDGFLRQTYVSDRDKNGLSASPPR